MVGEQGLQARINSAIRLAYNYGQIDGSHRKMWVIDQMVRALFGSGDRYDSWVYDYEQGDSDVDEEMSYEWDKGIAP